MALPLSTARAAKSMPKGKGYGAKKDAKKKANPFAKKAAAKKGAKAAKKPAAAGTKGKKGVPPAFLKNMKKKSSKK